MLLSIFVAKLFLTIFCYLSFPNHPSISWNRFHSSFLTTKVIMYKSRGEPFLWNRIWDLGPVGNTENFEWPQSMLLLTGVFLCIHGEKNGWNGCSTKDTSPWDLCIMTLLTTMPTRKNSASFAMCHFPSIFEKIYSNAIHYIFIVQWSILLSVKDYFWGLIFVVGYFVLSYCTQLYAIAK